MTHRHAGDAYRSVLSGGDICCSHKQASSSRWISPHRVHVHHNARSECHKGTLRSLHLCASEIGAGTPCHSGTGCSLVECTQKGDPMQQLHDLDTVRYAQSSSRLGAEPLARPDRVALKQKHVPIHPLCTKQSLFSTTTSPHDREKKRTSTGCLPR
jgi:hypothetical protein